LKKFFLVLFLIIIFFSIYINTTSLWDDKAGDIYNRKIFYNVGDSINIIITESSKFEYKSSTKSLKSYDIDISGGELSGLFNFLPKAYIEEDKNSLDNDSLKIESMLQGRILRVSDNYVTIRGTKRIQMNNKISSITITGDAYYSDIIDNSIISNKMINPTLSLTTLLDNQRRIITERDLFTEVLNPDSTTDRIETTKLTEEKKREILLNFFNKILNLIF
jgi:flagellar basal body L-ring protein FlgH